MTATRRLAAILAADVAGHSRLMGADEESAHFLFAAIRHHAATIRAARHILL
jgi:class 3 adenylate cyclase